MDISGIAVNALREAYFTQRKLFEDGTIAEYVSKGKGEDKATRGDWESEEVVINYLTEARIEFVADIKILEKYRKKVASLQRIAA